MLVNNYNNQSRNCVLSSLFQLFYKTGRLRIVISTANLIAYDWRDMENVLFPSLHSTLTLIAAQSVWLQDIPLRSKPIDNRKVTDDFPAILQRTLHAVNVRPALAAMISDNVTTLPPNGWKFSNNICYFSIRSFPWNLLTSCVKSGTGQMSRSNWSLPLRGSIRHGPVSSSTWSVNADYCCWSDNPNLKNWTPEAYGSCAQTGVAHGKIQTEQGPCAWMSG